jgi:sucrose-6-phosphate hydrolase SacC (GH32 family)
MLLNELNWQRSQQPALSAMTTEQTWCRVTLYNPTVICVDGVYKMWYLGNSSRTRNDDMSLGYAESDDGLHWRAYADNPILRTGETPVGPTWQTPHVLFDAAEGIYKMWFIMSQRLQENGQLGLRQLLGYATSPNGLQWDIHPEPIYPSGRRPCVLKDGPNSYHMWMNSAPEADDDFRAMARYIYHFTSTDGLNWNRDPEPVVRANETQRSIVYPYVLQNNNQYTMWYGCHVEGGIFEIFSSTSTDGLNWTDHFDQAAFPATRDPNHFDGRYTSTPCVVDDKDRYLLYYSARDQGNIYGAGDGTIQVDQDGIYRHIGVAVCAKP